MKEVEATVSRATHEVSTDMSAVEETLIQIVKRIETIEARIQRIENTLEHSS